jgi:hypothetical protein
MIRKYYAVTEEAKIKIHECEVEDEIDLQEMIVDLEAHYYKNGIAAVLFPEEDLSTLIKEISQVKSEKLCKCCKCDDCKG